MESVAAVVDLCQKRTWDPGRLIAARFQWPIPWEHRMLDDIGQQLEPQVLVEHGTQVIAPTGLDRVYGGVRKRTTKYRGAGYLVGGDPLNVQPGDVLIPAGADLPGIIVDESLLGSTVSTGFSAYRFQNTIDAYWIWAVINSVAGRQFRRAYLTQSLSSERARLGSATFPWPEDVTRASLSEAIASIEKQTHRDEDEGVETWWSTADLHRHSWRIALATPEPIALMDGVPLSDLALEIKSGRAFDRKIALTAQAEGAFPVVTGSTLAGRPFTRWLPDAPSSTLAEPGDLLIAAVGERAHAQINDHRVAIDSGVYRVRLDEQRYARAVVSFLNGQKGFGLRKMVISGAVVPRVSRRDLEKIRIPSSVLEAPDVDNPIEPLSTQLERVLWAS